MRVDASRELWLHVAAPKQAVTHETGAAPDPVRGELLVRIARPTDIPAKLSDVQQALLAWREWGTQAKYLDVMCAGQPAYKLLDESQDPSKSAGVE